MDTNTLQAQLDKISSDTQTFTGNIKQRLELIEKLKVEVEQHRGAHAYALQLSEHLRKQLTDLAEKAT